MARLCQSLVMGKYASISDPGNNYVLQTQANGWDLLVNLQKTDDEILFTKWNKIAASCYNEM